MMSSRCSLFLSSSSFSVSSEDFIFIPRLVALWSQNSCLVTNITTTSGSRRQPELQELHSFMSLSLYQGGKSSPEALPKYFHLCLFGIKGSYGHFWLQRSLGKHAPGMVSPYCSRWALLYCRESRRNDYWVSRQTCLPRLCIVYSTVQHTVPLCPHHTEESYVVTDKTIVGFTKGVGTET